MTTGTTVCYSFGDRVRLRTGGAYDVTPKQRKYVPTNMPRRAPEGSGAAKV